MSIKPFSAVKHPRNFFKFRIPCGSFSKYSANMTPLAGVTPAIGRFSNKILGDGNVVLTHNIHIDIDMPSGQCRSSSKSFKRGKCTYFGISSVGDGHADIVNILIFQILLADPPRILHSGIIINLNDYRRNIGSLSKELLLQLITPD